MRATRPPANRERFIALNAFIRLASFKNDRENGLKFYGGVEALGTHFESGGRVRAFNRKKDFHAEQPPVFFRKLPKRFFRISAAEFATSDQVSCAFNQMLPLAKRFPYGGSNYSFDFVRIKKRAVPVSEIQTSLLGPVQTGKFRI